MGFFSRERPNGLPLVALQIIGSISGRPMRCIMRCTRQPSRSRCSTSTASAVYMLTSFGTHSLLYSSSGIVSIMASPQSMRPFSPFQSAAAVAGE